MRTIEADVEALSQAGLPNVHDVQLRGRPLKPLHTTGRAGPVSCNGLLGGSASRSWDLASREPRPAGGRPQRPVGRRRLGVARVVSYSRPSRALGAPRLRRSIDHCDRVDLSGASQGGM